MGPERHSGNVNNIYSTAMMHRRNRVPVRVGIVESRAKAKSVIAEDNGRTTALDYVECTKGRRIPTGPLPSRPEPSLKWVTSDRRETDRKNAKIVASKSSACCVISCCGISCCGFWIRRRFGEAASKCGNFRPPFLRADRIASSPEGGAWLSF